MRVIQNEDSLQGEEESESEPIDIHAAMGRFKRLVIVGDPGSGKSTFLKYIALIIARSEIEKDNALASEKLNLDPPLPTPFFISLWDLSDYIRETGKSQVTTILEYLVATQNEKGIKLTVDVLDNIFLNGQCCLLFDGLDEVPTEQGRSMISRLVENFVQKYPENRFVVTSRVRGYTGDTILKASFIRCDIQDFNGNDRSEFLKNWFSALFKISRHEVLTDGSQSRQAYDSIIPAIEGNDRIRKLAVNPLLMTVIAIVHWNRKRLPDQRVELYDECIDVLLGQRKTAERTIRKPDLRILNPEFQEDIETNRAWRRKRFSEIALQILVNTQEEITHDAVLKLLAPRFLSRGAKDLEHGEALARTFLENEELQSGLIVSRRSQSCRFVHLTFQEYLAAWNLASQNFDELKPVIKDHLRDPKWFETLQLIGDELAKRSDERFDKFIGFLLENSGEKIYEQAPVIALCANILKDTKEVADIKSNTRDNFTIALKGTLDAFKYGSGIAAKIQLEVVEALAILGSSVKEHLIQASKSSYYEVRSRALEILVPHVSDDDLFEMDYILQDRSYNTICTYLKALLGRDKNRLGQFLLSRKNYQQKALRVITSILPIEGINKNTNILITTNVLTYIYPYSEYLYNDIYALLIRFYIEKISFTPDSWKKIIEFIAVYKESTIEMKDLIVSHSLRVEDIKVREDALLILAKSKLLISKDRISDSAINDKEPMLRIKALQILEEVWKEDTLTWEFIRRRALEDENGLVRRKILSILLDHDKNLYENRDIFLLVEDINVPYWYDNGSNVIDPMNPIDNTRVSKCSKALKINENEIWERYKKLAEILPLKLQRE